MSRSVGVDKAGILEIRMPSVRHRARDMGTDEAWKRRKRSEELTSKVGWKWDRVVRPHLRSVTYGLVNLVTIW